MLWQLRRVLAAGDRHRRAGPGLPGRVGAITRTDGSRQLTYNAHPLYTYGAARQRSSGTGVPLMEASATSGDCRACLDNSDSVWRGLPAEVEGPDDRPHGRRQRLAQVGDERLGG
jgi:hypothetical protein